MKKMKVKELTVESMISRYGGHSIGNDLVMFSRKGNRGLPADLVRMNCLFMGICLSGNAVHSVDTEEYSISQGNIMVINEGQILKCKSFSNNFKGIIICCTTKFFNEIVSNVHALSTLLLFTRDHPVLELTPKEMRMAMQYLDLLKIKIEDKDRPYYRETVLHLLAATIYDLNGTISRMQGNKKQSTRVEQIFTDFISLLEKNFRVERRVSWYAGQLDITPKYLLEAVKQTSRRTPNEWIDKYIILEIRTMLRGSAKNIKEIAEELNFPNQSFLGRYFKENMGMSPSKYRESPL